MIFLKGHSTGVTPKFSSVASKYLGGALLGEETPHKVCDELIKTHLPAKKFKNWYLTLLDRLGIQTYLESGYSLTDMKMRLGEQRDLCRRVSLQKS